MSNFVTAVPYAETIGFFNGTPPVAASASNCEILGKEEMGTNYANQNQGPSD